MPTKKNIAGVFTTEEDQSQTIAATASNVGAIVVRAPKGVTNREVIISNYQDYIDKFGNVQFSASDNPTFGFSNYMSDAFLSESNELHVLRVTDDDDKYPIVDFQVGFSAGDTWESANVDYSGISASLTPENPDTPTRIQALDDGIGATDIMLVAATGPGIDGHNLGITIETFNVSADWLLKYDEFPTNSAWGEVLMSASNGGYSTVTQLSNACVSAGTTLATLLPIATQIIKLRLYQKKTTESWEDINSFIENADLALSALDPIEEYYGTIGYQKDGSGNQLKITEVINGVSNLIYVVTNTATFDYEVLPEETFIFPLSGGAISYATGLGDTDSTAVLNGLEFFRHKEYASFRMLLNCDWNTTIKQKVAEICSLRMDCIGTGQCGSSADDTVEKILIQEKYGYRNSSYIGLYAGWPLINDTYNNKKVYVPEAIFAPMLMARCDAVGNTWDAPAGTDRGILPVLGMRKTFTFDEIGRLQKAGINTSRWMKAYGHVMWGQRTALLTESKRNRINVRRLLIYIESNVENTLLPFCFNIVNTDKNRTRLASLINDFLDTTKAGSNPGCTAAEAICNEDNNPPNVIDQNQLVVGLYLTPSSTVEEIFVKTIITKTGVSFTETVV